ncbi:MAG: hypothetical protein ACTSU5_03850 [Promethearchaeota archaeon]
MKAKRRANLILSSGLLVGGLLFLTLAGMMILPRTAAPIGRDAGVTGQFPVPASVESWDNAEMTDLSRHVDINEYGVVTVMDTYTIKNDGVDSLGSFVVLETRAQAENSTVYRSFNMKSGESCGFQFLARELNGYRQLLVLFPDPVGPEETITFTYTHVLRGLVSVSGTETSQDFVLETILFPPTVLDCGVSTATFVFPKDSDITSSSPESTTDNENILTYNYNNITKFTTTPARFEYSYTTSTILQLQSLDREISVDTWGHLSVAEYHVIQNLGTVSVSSFVIQIPEDASSVQLSDDLGGISGFSVESDANADGTKNVTINLKSNRAEIGGGTYFRYNLAYNLPLDENFQSSWYTHAFEINSYLSKYQFLGTHETTKIILIGGDEVLSVEPEPDQIISVGNNIALVYESDYVSALHEKDVRVLFKVDPYQVLLRPLLFIFLLAVISTGYVVLRKGMKRGREFGILEDLEIPKRELREFVKLYEEKNALILEMDTVSEDIRRKKVRKKQGVRALKEAQSKIKEVEFEIAPLKDVLLLSDPRIVKILDRLEYLETERVSLKDSIKLLEQRYRRGKLQSRASFERLRDDLNKRIEKIQKTVDRSVSELKGFLV